MSSTTLFLGRHFGCRPLDPTLDIWSNFNKKLGYIGVFCFVLLGKNEKSLNSIQIEFQFIYQKIYFGCIPELKTLLFSIPHISLWCTS